MSAAPDIFVAPAPRDAPPGASPEGDPHRGAHWLGETLCQNGSQSLRALEDRAKQEMDAGDHAALVHLYRALHDQIDAKSAVLQSAPEAPWVTLEGVSVRARKRFVDIAPDMPVRLSRFAMIHAEDGALVIESPLSGYRLLLDRDTCVPVLAALAAGTTARACGDKTGLDCPQLLATFSLFGLAGLIAEQDAAGKLPEDTDETLMQWEPHDLFFHWRSRMGWHDRQLGATYRFFGRVEPQRAIRAEPDHVAKIALPVPDTTRLQGSDPSLFAVMERRTSRRPGRPRPLTLFELGSFLFRAARVKGIKSMPMGTFTERPYPNGGASYELEIYLTIREADGIAPGFYYYSPNAHALCMISGWSDRTARVIAQAQKSMADICQPQIVLTLASRFQRVSWKYAGIAYATQLKNVGALYSIFYLVAEAEGISACGLGLGDAQLFADLSGCAPFAEGAVGEFALSGPEMAPPSAQVRI